MFKYVCSVCVANSELISLFIFVELYQPKTATTTERSTKDGSTKPVKEKKEKKEKKTKKVLSEESRLMNRLVKERAMFKEKRESVKKDTLEPKMPDFAPLPEIRRLKRSEFVDDFTDSIVECDDEMIRTPKEMITGQTIVSLREHAEAKTVSLQPLLFKVKADCPPSAVKDESQNTFVERGKVLMDKSFFQVSGRLKLKSVYLSVLKTHLIMALFDTTG